MGISIGIMMGILIIILKGILIFMRIFIGIFMGLFLPIFMPIFVGLREFGESYIVLYHISQFDCFLFARIIRDLSMTPAICHAYHKLVWDVSASQPVCKL